MQCYFSRVNYTYINFTKMHVTYFYHKFAKPHFSILYILALPCNCTFLNNNNNNNNNITTSKTTLTMVIDHTVDDNVSMSGSSSNSSTTTRFFNFGTDNIVVRVYDQKTKIERPNVIDFSLNSDIDNNDNDAHSVTSISSSSTFSSVQIIEPPPSSIPLVTPETQGSDCNREGDDNSSWYLSKFPSTMTKSAGRTTEQQIADITSGRSVLSSRNRSRPQTYNPSSVTHTDGNDNNNT